MQGLKKLTSSSTNIIPKPTNSPAIQNQNLMKAIMPAMNLPTEGAKKMFMMAMKRYDVTEKELEDAFWSAYADPYVPSAGIEFRHLWKHIEVDRLGSDRRSFTYEQMLNKMEKERIPMEAFSIIDELDSQGRKKWVLK